jgi:hypothetical protein
MRLVPLLGLAVLVAGCSGGSAQQQAAPPPTMHIGLNPKLIRPPAMGRTEAVREERSARGQWLRSLRASARSGSDQRFPTPSREVLLRRLEREARIHDFQIVSLRMVRARQLAPVIVVRTTHAVSLAHATVSILERLDPNWGRGEAVELYEGTYFAAVDERGIPLFSASEVVRGGYEGGSWARSEALYPIPTF